MRFSQKLVLGLNAYRRYSLAKWHPLRQLFWETTLRCNANCRHCGSDCSAISTNDFQKGKHSEMPLADFLYVLDTEITPNVNPNELLIILSGGEPLVRSDIIQIGAEIKKRGYPWGMVTNGIAMTNEKFRTLCEVGLRSMSISLDGLEEDHLWMRRSPSAFEGACRTIRLCADNPNLTWDVVTCVTPRVINKLSKIKKFLWELGCRHWRLVNVDPMGRGGMRTTEENERILLNAAEFKLLLDFIASERTQKQHVSYGCPGFLGEYEGHVRDHLYRCAAGIEVASILSDGHISACTSIRGKYYQGNIYKDRFWDVWNNKFEPYRNRKWMHQRTPCNTCEVWHYCRGNGMHLRQENGQLLICHYNGLYKNKLYPPSL